MIEVERRTLPHGFLTQTSLAFVALFYARYFDGSNGCQNSCHCFDRIVDKLKTIYDFRPSGFRESRDRPPRTAFAGQ